MAEPSNTKRWYSLTRTEPTKVHDHPPLGDAMAEDTRAIKELMQREISAPSWTTWTTGNPPDGHSDGGLEADF